MPALQSDPNRPLDAVCVGNAIVDVLAQVSDDFLTQHAMVKGSMQITDPDRAKAIYADMPPAIEMSGGSAANTAAGLASLGRRAAFIGKVAEDSLGEVFAHDIRAIGVDFHGAVAIGESAAAGTARCLVCVTDDAERTMNTSLGVAGQIEKSEVAADVIAEAKVVYIEGYLWDEPIAKDSIRFVMEKAAQVGTPIAFTLSDSFCVERHRQEFLQLLTEHVDILFANTEEILSLCQVDSLEQAISDIQGKCSIACITRSEKGSVIVTPDEQIEIAAAFTVPVDTTGAGDLYAAGFLAGWTAGASLTQSGEMASIAAAEAISHLGARPQTNLAELVKRELG